MQIAYVGSARNRFIASYMSFMTARGHDVILYNVDRGEASHQHLAGNVVDISCGADTTCPGTKWRYGLAAIKLHDMITKARPDVLHAHYASSAGLVCLLAGVRPYIVSIHGSDILVRSKSMFWRTILRGVLAGSQLVHTVSEELATKAVWLAGTDRVSIRTLTQGTDLDLFQFEPRRDAVLPLRILCTRALKPIYSNETILLACKILSDEGFPFRLTFAAGGPLGAQLKKRAIELGILDRVEFLGGYDNVTLPQIMRRYHVYVSASMSDGTSVSLLEAMSAGLFPVVSRIESNIAWIEDGRNGLMFESGNARGLALAIRRIAVDDALRSFALEENRRQVEARGDRCANMALLEQWYFELRDSVKNDGRAC